MSDLFDDLRNDGGGPMNLDDEEGGNPSGTRYDNFEYQDLDDDPRPLEEQERPRKKVGKNRGMTPGQRMVLAFLLFSLSLIFSSACLLVTGRIVPF
ncbi:MAG: hypothetical protein Fur0022_30870 [Anaerolineales bacterium]